MMSSRHLCLRVRSSWFNCQRRKYDSYLLETLPRRTPFNLFPANCDSSQGTKSTLLEVQANRVKCVLRDTKNLDCHFISYESKLVKPEFREFGDIDLDLYCSSCKHWYRNGSAKESHEKLFPTANLPFVDITSSSKLSIERNEYRCTGTHKHPSKKSPSDDFNEKIRRLEMKLRSEIPKFMEPGKLQHDFNMYTSTVQLSVATSVFPELHVCSGLSAYKVAARVFRILCKLCLRKPTLDVMRIASDEQRRVIDVRWRVAGRPFYFQLLSFMLPPRLQKRYFDYVSILSVDERGQIFRHVVTKLRPVRTKLFGNSSWRVRKTLQPTTMMTPLESRPSRCKPLPND